jgi:hypothetical protein
MNKSIVVSVVVLMSLIGNVTVLASWKPNTTHSKAPIIVRVD